MIHIACAENRCKIEWEIFERLSVAVTVKYRNESNPPSQTNPPEVVLKLKSSESKLDEHCCQPELHVIASFVATRQLVNVKLHGI